VGRKGEVGREEWKEKGRGKKEGIVTRSEERRGLKGGGKGGRMEITQGVGEERKGGRGRTGSE